MVRNIGWANMAAVGADTRMLFKDKDLMREWVMACEDSKKQLDGLRYFRRMLCEDHNPHVQHIIQLGLVPYFVKYLKQGTAEIQVEAAWALTNVSAGTAEETEAVVEQGAIPALVDIMRKDKGSLKEQAIWAVGNIAAERQFRDVLIEKGALRLLLGTLQDDSASLSTVRIGTWALANFCRTRFYSGDTEELANTVIQVSANLLRQRDRDILADAVWALSSIAEWQDNYVSRIIAAGAIPHLVKHLGNRSPSVVHPTLRCLSSVALGPESSAAEVVACGALPRLKRLLMGHQKKRVLGNACLVLANLVASGWSTCQGVIDVGIMPLVMDVLRSSIYEVKCKAAFVVINAFTTSSMPYQGVVQLSNDGCIEALCAFLTWEQRSTVAAALTALGTALAMGELGRLNNGGGAGGAVLMNESYEMSEKAHKKRVRARGYHGRSNRVACQVSAAGGRETLRQLTEHECQEVASLARDLLGRYFQVDDVGSDLDEAHGAMEDGLEGDELEDGEDALSELAANGHGTEADPAQELQDMLEDWSVNDRSPVKPAITCAK
eukprot:evm.model.scf_421.3 EVM.evm.TU.scf_421.3   scf_421:14202-21155(-)